MVNRPSVPEIITVNSEELQTLIRDLLPSQNGFGSELQASNVITPIIDLTATAEGSTLRQDLQTAFAFGSQTAFSIYNQTTTIINQTGFWRVFGSVNNGVTSAAGGQCTFTLGDGATTKNLITYYNAAFTTSHATNITTPFDFVVFLGAGEDLSITANNLSNCDGSVRQIATGSGTFVPPNGYPL